MNIHKIALEAGKQRPALGKVIVTEDRVVACDGHILAITPNTEAIPIGQYTAQSFGKHAKDANYPLQTPDDGNTAYPDYTAVLGDRQALTTTVRIGINAELLATLTEALRLDRHDDPLVMLEIVDSDSPILVKLIQDKDNPNRIGLIMPCKLSPSIGG